MRLVILELYEYARFCYSLNLSRMSGFWMGDEKKKGKVKFSCGEWVMHEAARLLWLFNAVWYTFVDHIIYACLCLSLLFFFVFFFNLEIYIYIKQPHLNLKAYMIVGSTKYLLEPYNSTTSNLWDFLNVSISNLIPDPHFVQLVHPIIYNLL